MDIDELTRYVAVPSEVTTEWVDALDVLSDYIAERQPGAKLASDLKLMWEHHMRQAGAFDLRDYYRLRAFGWARQRHVDEFIRLRLFTADVDQYPWQLNLARHLPTMWLPLRDWVPFEDVADQFEVLRPPSQGGECIAYMKPISVFAYGTLQHPVVYGEVLLGKRRATGAGLPWSLLLRSGVSLEFRGIVVNPTPGRARVVYVGFREVTNGTVLAASEIQSSPS